MIRRNGTGHPRFHSRSASAPQPIYDHPSYFCKNTPFFIIFANRNETMAEHIACCCGGGRACRRWRRFEPDALLVQRQGFACQRVRLLPFGERLHDFLHAPAFRQRTYRPMCATGAYRIRHCSVVQSFKLSNNHASKQSNILAFAVRGLCAARRGDFNGDEGLTV